MPGYVCESCDYSTPYAMAMCPKCGSRSVKQAFLSGKGTVYTFTTIRVPPEGFEADVPYTVLAVRLDKGTLVPGRWVGSVEPVLGQRVVFSEATDKGFTFSPEVA
ncbi:MAG: Zn-ribbon domain-containing OB-fold protein [Ignavibacteriales bacterium]